MNNLKLTKFEDNICITYSHEKGTGILDAFRTVEGKGIQGNNIGDCWTVSRVKVDNAIRRQGIATEMLEAMCVKADEMKINLELDASPYNEENTPSEEELIKFFSKFGFVSHENFARNMVRLTK